MTPGPAPSAVESQVSRWVLVAVLCFCVLTRVGWLLHIRDTNPVATTSPDTPSYVNPARSFADSGTMDDPSTGEPIFVRTPGYPLFISAVLSVTDDLTAFLVVQVLVSCVTVLICYLVAARVWRPGVGAVAAAIVAVEPLQFAASGTLLTESLISLFLLLVVAAGYRAFSDGAVDVTWCAALGLAVAAASMIRPTTYYFPLVVVVFIAIVGRRLGARRVLAAVGAFLIPVVVVFGGWQLRNHETVGSWRFSGIESVNMYYYYAADVLAAQEGISVTEARNELSRRLATNDLAVCPTDDRCAPARPQEPGDYYDLIFRRGLDVVTSHPTVTAKQVAKSLGREIFGPGTDTVGRYLDVESTRPLSVLLALGLAVFYVATAYGVIVVLMVRGQRSGHVFALLVVAYVLIASAGPGIGYARFRGPVMPILALFAAVGIVTGFMQLRGRSRRDDADRNATASLVSVDAPG